MHCPLLYRVCQVAEQANSHVHSLRTVMYPKLYVEGGLIRGSAFSIKTLAESFGRRALIYLDNYDTQLYVELCTAKFKEVSPYNQAGRGFLPRI